MKRSTRVQWWEPRRSALPRLLDEFRPLLSVGIWCRMVALSTFIAGAILAWVLINHPGIALPWGRILLTLPAAVLMILLPLGLHALIPPHWDVRASRIHCAHGNANLVLKPEQILHLEIRTGEHPEFIIQYRTRRGRERTLRVGISRRVDLAELQQVCDELALEAKRRVTIDSAPPIFASTP